MAGDHSGAGKPDFLPVPVLKAKHPALGAGMVYPQRMQAEQIDQRLPRGLPEQHLDLIHDRVGASWFLSQRRQCIQFQF